MAVSETIQELLQGIDEAQYGRDMREYIHKGIQKCYEEGSAGETDLTARDGVLKILEMFGSVEDSSTASTAYAVGDTLVYDGRLYKVIAAIAQGDTLTEDTNIEEIAAKGITISPPDFTSMETVWHEQQTSTDGHFGGNWTADKDGWYSLLIAKPSSSTFGYAYGRIYTSPYDYTGLLAAVGQSTNGDIYLTTPWLYLKAGDVVKILGYADDGFWRYAPCL